MPKHGFLTAKAIGNRIKSKGLQKLRWYCQPCQKQCRDENGFKCHCMSESHQRQLLLVGENQTRIVEGYSDEFRNTFLKLLRRRYNTKRVMATRVYNEYIQDKEHLHMNSTHWHTLTEFVKHLGREGYCIVDETVKGWFITWIDRDPETIARQKRAEKMDAAKKDEEQRQAEAIRLQMERDKAKAEAAGLTFESEFTSLQKAEGDDPVTLKLATGALTATTAPSATTAAGTSGNSTTSTRGDDSAKYLSAIEAQFGISREGAVADGEAGEDGLPAVSASASLSQSSGTARDGKRKLSKVEQHMRDQLEAKKAKELKELELAKAAKAKAKQDAAKQLAEAVWVTPGIVVKVMNKELGDGRFYKRKGVIKSVEGAVAKVKIIDSKASLKLDQRFLETVIPRVGGDVLILQGKHAGGIGQLLKINTDTFDADLETEDKRTIRLPYEHFSKLA
eukprot:m.67595 g.67595  ORF g.67595 m.67595 type:complete len:449 (-) comp12165_c0_seq1:229-1575(-)